MGLLRWTQYYRVSQHPDRPIIVGAFIGTASYPANAVMIGVLLLLIWALSYKKN